METSDSGYCTHCGGTGATEYVGDDLGGKPLFAHAGQCKSLTVRRALGFPLVDLTRMAEQEEVDDRNP